MIGCARCRGPIMQDGRDLVCLHCGARPGPAPRLHPFADDVLASEDRERARTLRTGKRLERRLAAIRWLAEHGAAV